MKKPRTLQQAIVYFADPANCMTFLVARRWPTGVQCPTCGSKNVRFISTRLMWECKAQHSRKQFSVKVGTIFEDSALPLDKWLVAIWMIANCKNGVSSYEVARALGVTQKSAWFMLHRIRLAMQNRERGGEIRAMVVPNRKKHALQTNIRAHVKAGSAIYSDALMSYMGLKEDFRHEVIDHAEKYVDGQVHTNGLENFWSLLKRGLKGTYVSVEPFHLFRYLDEQVFRYNFRSLPHDGARFEHVANHLFGKRLTYAEVTGKVGQTTN